MQENKVRGSDRRTGFVCTELPYMTGAGLTVAMERRQRPDRRANRIRADWLDKHERS